MDILIKKEYDLNIYLLKDISSFISKTDNDVYFPYDIIYNEKIKKYRDNQIQQLRTEILRNKKKTRYFKENYFPYYPSLYFFNKTINGLLIDQLCISPIGSFSSSRKQGVEFISSCILEIYGNSVHCFSFIDATGNIGTDTIGFILLTSNKVYGIELNHDDYIIMVNNVQCYNFRNDKQYELINDDSLEVIPQIINTQQNGQQPVDIIYFDPPWGGKKYSDYEKINLFLSGINIADIVKDYINKGYVNEGIIIKVPYNFNIDFFIETVTTDCIRNISIIVKEFKSIKKNKPKHFFSIIIVKLMNQKRM